MVRGRCCYFTVIWSLATESVKVKWLYLENVEVPPQMTNLLDLSLYLKIQDRYRTKICIFKV